MGNEQSKKPPTIQELTNACVPMRLPFTNAAPPEKLWNHDPNDVDQVYPNIFVSGGAFAQNLRGIKKRDITHVLNTAQGVTYMHVDTNEDTYPEEITFKGIKANDSYVYDMSKHFDECAEFIEEAINSGGKVLVHCRQGFSRSPTIVAVYLMKKKGMTARRALETMSGKRKICPNEGFMKSLIELDTAMFHPEFVKSQAVAEEKLKEEPDSTEKSESKEPKDEGPVPVVTITVTDEKSDTEPHKPSPTISPSANGTQ